jgi:adenine-specific DNA glycosylase
VLRVSNRIGIAEGDDPVAVEAQLSSALPKEQWTLTSDVLILHGRRICRPKPLCEQCPVRDDCDYYRNVVARSDVASNVVTRNVAVRNVAVRSVAARNVGARNVAAPTAVALPGAPAKGGRGAKKVRPGSGGAAAGTSRGKTKNDARPVRTPRR